LADGIRDLLYPGPYPHLKFSPSFTACKDQLCPELSSHYSRRR
jgi:hypothetical protein